MSQAKQLRGAPVAAALTQELADKSDQLCTKLGRRPCLALVRVGSNEDDMAYERAALKRADKCHIDVRLFELPAAASFTDLEAVAAQISSDTTIDGCMMFRPLPPHLDEVKVCELFSPAKDIDGSTQSSILYALTGIGNGFVPCTAEAVLRLLDFYEVPIQGSNVCMVGRSLVIGKPAAMQLLARGASVDLCHSKTQNLAAHTKTADIIVVATGHPHTITQDHVRPGQTVIDVGINVDPATGKLIGDADTEALESIVDAITPVPGGIGSLTTAILCEHVLQAADKSLG